MVSLDGASFSRRRKEGMVIIYRGMVYAKFFYGEMVLFSGGMVSPRVPPQLEFWLCPSFVKSSMRHCLISLINLNKTGDAVQWLKSMLRVSEPNS